MENQRIITKLIISVLTITIIICLSLIPAKTLLKPETASAAYESNIFDTLPVDPGGTQTGATDMFIKIEGIDGESENEGHQNWSDIESFCQGQFIDDSGVSTRSGGQLIFDNITIVKQLDKASPKIAEAVCKGTVFPKVEIHVADSIPRSTPYYTYQLGYARITSYSICGSGDVPVEEFSLNFEQIRVEYDELDAAGNSKGKVEYTWKVEEGES